jgi:ribosomal protein L40E
VSEDVLLKGEFYQDSEHKSHRSNNFDSNEEAWNCRRCGYHNYAIRKICLKCKIRKGEDLLIDDAIPHRLFFVFIFNNCFEIKEK